MIGARVRGDGSAFVKVDTCAGKPGQFGTPDEADMAPPARGDGFGRMSRKEHAKRPRSPFRVTSAFLVIQAGSG